jgi:hypothetical protein
MAGRAQRESSRIWVWAPNRSAAGPDGSAEAAMSQPELAILHQIDVAGGYGPETEPSFVTSC